MFENPNFYRKKRYGASAKRWHVSMSAKPTVTPVECRWAAAQ
jgi:hypothetical protein